MRNYAHPQPRERIRLSIFYRVFLIFVSFLSTNALAARVVYFDVAGTSITSNTDELCGTCFIAKCYINVTNPTLVDQTVKVDFTHTVTTIPASTGTSMDAGGTTGGAVEGGSLSPGSNFTLSGGQRAIYAWTFPALAAETVVQQNIRCTGKITVDDINNVPGFVTASGLLFTWMQAPRPVGGTGIELRAPTSIITTTIPIGEGRPF